MNYVKQDAETSLTQTSDAVNLRRNTQMNHTTRSVTRAAGGRETKQFLSSYKGIRTFVDYRVLTPQKRDS